jgi:hypothetical protein
MGRNTPTVGVMMQRERNLSDFRKALMKADQRVFDALWVHVSKYVMACTHANHLLAFEIFLLAMLMEEHKEVIELRGEVVVEKIGK